MSKQLDAARRTILESFAGPCDIRSEEFYLSSDKPYTYEDVADLQDAFYGGGGLNHIHMSDLPGELCWRSRGPVEDRKFADKVRERCREILAGRGAEEKCNALFDLAGEYAKPKEWKTNFMYVGGALAALATLAAFGTHGWREWGRAIKIIARGGAISAGGAAATEAGAAAMWVIAPIAAFAGGLAFGHFVVNKGGAYLAGVKTHDGEVSLSAWYADEIANLTPRFAQLMIHDIAADPLHTAQRMIHDTAAWFGNPFAMFQTPGFQLSASPFVCPVF